MFNSALNWVQEGVSRKDFECKDKRTVYWFTAKEGSQVIHFISAADFHVRPPAIIVLHSNFMDSTVSINCTAYEKNATFRNSVKVSAVTASYGLVLYELCDYIDIGDKAELPPDTDCHNYFGSNLDWELKDAMPNSANEVTVSFIGTKLNDSGDLFLPGGSVKVQFTVYAKDTKPYDAFYYEVAGGLCVEVRIVIDRLKAKNEQTRVAPVLLVFSNQSMEDDDDFVQVSGYSRTMFDGPLGKLPSQYILLDKRVKAGQMGHDTPPAYIQSVPVSITNPDPVGASHSLRLANLAYRKLVKHSSTAKKYSRSLVYAYYGDRFNQVHQGSHEGYVGAREQFVNLGTPKDGFYVASNYSAWTLLLHLGTPDLQPTGSQNPAVVASLTIVGLAVVAGGAGVAYRRRRQLLAQQLVHRVEPQFGEPVATTVRERMDPVEPFQRRKMFSLFRNRRPGETSTEPLLTDPPPSYDSVSNTDL
ncbi:hypothetical protein T265_04955 [Opisthorchis viverrini]|uniref:Uncharacterized protein n=1 Tax=Opisthorchis viverrini TaxID=6198 RepID=A0A074ZXQ4_OPIVI|nr:hypothetical protein T265_04955 [Opisthorchis viverrini]KER28115.1 hypothetical protein T265_04955 [Opisthorchis viverrini]